MTSEQQARRKIDKVLEHAVLLFQDYKELNLSVGAGIVVREHLTDLRLLISILKGFKKKFLIIYRSLITTEWGDYGNFLEKNLAK